MTTRKEKFEAARNNMLSQSGKKPEIKKEKKGGYFKENITCEEDYEYDENGEKLLPLWENQEELDEFRRESAEERKRDKIREKENEEMWDTFNRKQRILKGYANAVCWLGFIVCLILSGWSAIHMFCLTDWSMINSIGKFIFILVFNLIIDFMVFGLVFCLTSTVVFLLIPLSLGQFSYWKWLGNGMNPDAF